MFNQIKLNKLKAMYSSDIVKSKKKSAIRALYPIVPKPNSKRYKTVQALILNAGLHTSVEQFYVRKIAAFVIAFVFLISMQTTNIFLKYEEIVSDVNLGKTIMSTVVEPTEQNIQRERELFRIVEQNVSSKEVPAKMLGDQSFKGTVVEYIQGILLSKGVIIDGEDPTQMAERMYSKLNSVRVLQSGYSTYMQILLISIVMFFLPNLLGMLKIMLIEDKKDWEILNCIYVYTIFGRLPPYKIKNILPNMVLVTDIFRPFIEELTEGVNESRGEEAFDRVMDKVSESTEMYDIIETMKLSTETGILDSVNTIDEMAVEQLRWIEIKGIKRRRWKQMYGMIPIAVLGLLGYLYFSYSLGELQNPMNLVNFK